MESLTGDFKKYEKSILIPDQSAWQQVSFWYTQCDVKNIKQFLSDKDIQVITTSNSASELTKQIYNPNLFGCDLENTITFSGANPKELVISEINFVPTTYPVGDFDIKVWKVQLEKKPYYQQVLWDSTPSFQRLLRNKKSKADISNIFLARDLSHQGKKFFIFTNDNDQIKQYQIEGFSYMRPIGMLLWMLEDGYINSRQKLVWVYEKMKKHNVRWVPKNTSFKNLCQTIKIKNMLS